MCAQNPNYPNFLDKQDPNFTAFFNTVDNLFKSLCASGVGSTSLHKKEVAIYTKEESLLWSSGVLNRCFKHYTISGGHGDSHGPFAV